MPCTINILSSHHLSLKPLCSEVINSGCLWKASIVGMSKLGSCDIIWIGVYLINQLQAPTGHFENTIGKWWRLFLMLRVAPFNLGVLRSPTLLLPSLPYQWQKLLQIWFWCGRSLMTWENSTLFHNWKQRIQDDQKSWGTLYSDPNFLSSRFHMF